MTDWQFTLNGVTFGSETSYVLREFEHGKPETRDQDRPAPREDGARMGRDYLSGAVFSFTLSVLKPEGATDAMDSLAILRKAWEGPRSESGDVVALTFQRPGADPKRVYGRPRRFTPTWADVIFGWIPVVAEFQTVDHRTYADAEGFNSVSLVPPSAGGLEAPLVAPLSTVAQSEEPGEITVGGDEDAWLVATFHGPVTRPVLEVLDEWRMELAITLASDQSVTVDPRPWSRGVRRENGANVAGTLTGDSPRLSRLRVPPGEHVVVFRGEDETGTASLDVRWRDAYLSL